MGTARCGPACRVVWGERVQTPFLPDSTCLFVVRSTFMNDTWKTHEWGARGEWGLRPGVRRSAERGLVGFLRTGKGDGGLACGGVRVTTLF